MNASSVAEHAKTMAELDFPQGHRNSTPSNQYDEEEAKLYRMEYCREWRRLQKEKQA